VILRLALLAVLLAAVPARAAFEDLGSGARATGMGNAFTAVADDLHAHHYNPAGLGQLLRPQFSATYSKLHLGLSDNSDINQSQFALAYPLRRSRLGVLGLAVHQLALSGLYTERSIYLSYGRSVIDREDDGELFLGGSLKYLGIGFNRPPEASNALDLGQATGQADPVLSGDTSKWVPDVDLGLLYRFRQRLFFGLAIKHFLEPNLAFSDSDKAPLKRGYNLGAAYRALWMNLTSELQFNGAPDGSMDKNFILGAERYLPTLRGGQIGFRGALALGSRDFRQIHAGFSYRINKIQFDYSFLMPLGTVRGTAGTHRAGLTFHFGAPTPEEAYEAELLEKIKTMEEPKASYAYEFESLPAPPSPVFDDERFVALKIALMEGQYAKAKQAVAGPLASGAAEAALISLGHRLDIVAGSFPALDKSAGAWHAALYEAIDDFLYGRDKAAVLKASHAMSLNPGDENLNRFLIQLENVTKRNAERVPPGIALNLVALKLREAETLFLGRKMEEAAKLCKDVLVIEPQNPRALALIGSAHYMKQEHKAAIAYWKKSLEFEKGPTQRQTLGFMIDKAGREAAKPRKAARQAAKPKAKKRRRNASPRAIERLYEYGVSLYTKGQWEKAAEAFEKILELDPENVQARRALNRLEQQIMLRKGVHR